MAHGDGGIPVLQQHGERLPDHQTASDDDNIFPPEGNTVVIQKLDTCLRCAGGKASSLSGKDSCQGTGRHAVDVFLGQKRVTGGKFIQLRRQGAEHQTAVDSAVPVDPVNCGKKLNLSTGLRKSDTDHTDPDCFTALLRSVFIAQIINPLSDSKNRKTGRKTLFIQKPGTGNQVVGDGCRDRCSLQYFSHDSSSITRSSISNILSSDRMQCKQEIL